MYESSEPSTLRPQDGSLTHGGPGNKIQYVHRRRRCCYTSAQTNTQTRPHHMCFSLLEEQIINGHLTHPPEKCRRWLETRKNMFSPRRSDDLIPSPRPPRSFACVARFGPNKDELKFRPHDVNNANAGIKSSCLIRCRPPTSPPSH